MFKRNDYITIKEGTILDTGEQVNDWAGQVLEVYSKEKTCLITLDAQSIKSMSDAYILNSIEQGAEPFEYVFLFEDIEISQRRDTDEQVMEALDQLSSRVIEFEGNQEQEMEQIKEQWIEEFYHSQYFEQQSDYQKENSNFIIGTFMDFMHNYEYVKPQEWEPLNIKEVCLNIAPRKITADSEVFENYGDVIQQYIRFLGSKQYITNWKELVITIKQIKSKIPKEADNPNNWGMAKSMMMGAQEQGFDMSNEDDIEKFMMLQQLEAMKQIQEDKQGRIIPLRENPFKDIGRNQKITVKYNNGDILENIKFKKVERDLKDGKCEIIKK